VNSVALDPLPSLPDDHDLVSSKGVRKEFGDVSLMTLWRWRNEPKDPRLRFPAPDVVINDHNYWYRRTLRQYRQQIKMLKSAPVGAASSAEAETIRRRRAS
jgi:hypothetical protein